MGLGISSPFKEILKLLSAPMSPQVQDLFHFILFLPFHQIRWWFWEIFTMLLHLLVW
jgi:hypothetical protein